MTKKLSLILLLLFIFSPFVKGLNWTITNTWSWYMWKISNSHFTSSISDTNFGKTFGTWNYRWAIPTSQSINILQKEYWIKTIISLIPTSQMSKALQKSIKDSGINRIVIPLTDHPPKKSDRQKILSALKSWHTFVHCKYWADRTWAIIARARVELKWISPDIAYKDMLSYNAKVEKIAKYKTAFKYFKSFIYNGYK